MKADIMGIVIYFIITPVMLVVSISSSFFSRYVLGVIECIDEYQLFLIFILSTATMPFAVCGLIYSILEYKKNKTV